MKAEDNILELKNISKYYPGVTALNNVSLKIRKGEIHALVGENGAGKSTLIKTCSGAIAPSSGEICVNGKTFKSMTPKTSEENGIGVIYQEFNLVGDLSVAENIFLGRAIRKGPSSGEICVNGKTFKSMTPKTSEENGIGVIYQEFNLVGDLSVAENIFLGRAIRKGIIIDLKAMERESKKILDSLHINISPKTLVKNLSVGYQQMVEIAKAMSQNAQVLIMDEPSAPLTSAEVESMFAIVDLLKEKGVSIIYISHRLEEIFRLSDRVTVLRDGEYVTTLNTAETNEDELVKYMVGRELTEIYPTRKADSIKDEVLFEAVNVSGNGDKNISFKIHKGEVLGFGGLIGAGRTEMAELMFGMKPKTSGKFLYKGKEINPKSPKEAIDVGIGLVPVGAGRTEMAELMFGMKPKTSGKFLYKGKEINPKSPKEAIDVGIGLVPEDRKAKGALLTLSIQENINMPIYPRISKATVINEKTEREIAQKYKEEISIKTPNLTQLVKNLSGGNQQKVILAKWLAADSELLIFDEPTRGIDVGAKQEIYTLINTLVEQGKAVLMISSEMEELMGMSDRIIILAEGSVSGELRKEEFKQETIMKYASKEMED